MKMWILDTNVLVRFLVGDNLGQQKQAERWFKSAEKGARSILVTPLVVAETCFVLESFYKKNKTDVANALEVFLTQPWLQVENRDVLIGLWVFYRKGLHFVDSFMLSWSELCGGEVLTFDRKLKQSSTER